jgi:hypothetical protein
MFEVGIWRPYINVKHVYRSAHCEFGDGSPSSFHYDTASVEIKEASFSLLLQVHRRVSFSNQK